MLLVSAVILREFISYMQIARLASSVYHTSFQMSLLFSWFPILSQVNFFLRIIPTHYKTCFLCCALAPQPDLKQFQIVRVARISLKHINSDLENVVYVLLEKLRLLALLLC